MAPSVLICNVSKTHVNQGQTVELSMLPSKTTWNLDTEWFYLNGIGYASTGDNTTHYFRNQTIGTSGTTYQLNCCAIDVNGNMGCRPGPYIYPTSECGGNMYDLDVMGYIKCWYTSAWGGDV